MNNTTDVLLQQVIDRLGEIVDKLDGVNDKLSELSLSVTALVDSSAIVDEIDRLREDIGKKDDNNQNDLRSLLNNIDVHTSFGITIADKAAATVEAIEGLKEDFGEKLEELTVQLTKLASSVDEISDRSDVVGAIERISSTQ